MRFLIIAVFFFLAVTGSPGRASAADVGVTVDFKPFGREIGNITGINLSRSKKDIERFMEEAGPGLYRIKWIIYKAREEDIPLIARVAKDIHDRGGKVMLQIYGIPRQLSSKPNDSSVKSNAIEEFSKYPPKDYGQWRELVKSVVRKFRSNNVAIDYYEIFGEPNIGSTWYGKGELKSAKSFYELYSQTAAAIREAEPEAKVGGAGFFLERLPLDMDNPKHPMIKKTKVWMESFLLSARENNAPVDFFSIHIYEDDAKLFANYPGVLKKYLSGQGYNIPLFVTEWNFNAGRKMDGRADEMYGASFVTAAMIEMMKAGVDGQTFYMLSDMARPFGLFTKNGRPKPSYHAFKLVSAFKGEAAEVSADDERVHAIAVRGQGGLEILGTYYIPSEDPGYGGRKNLRLSVSGVPFPSYKIEIFKVAEKGLEPAETLNKSGENVSLEFTLPVYGVFYVRITSD